MEKRTLSSCLIAILFLFTITVEAAVQTDSLISVGDARLQIDSVTDVPIVLTSAGNVNGLSFSLRFDPTIVDFVAAGLGSAAQAGNLTINENFGNQGQVGIVLVLPSDVAFAEGASEIVVFQMTPVAGQETQSVLVDFDNSPTKLRVGDANANLITSEFVGRDLVIDRLLEITPVDAQQINEDTPLNIQVAFAGSFNRVLTLRAESSNQELISNEGLVVNGDVLTVTPMPDASGAGTISLFLTDGFETVESQFRIVVISVNDPPSIEPIENLTVAEDSGAAEVVLSGIGSGATNEAQNLSVEVRSSNAQLTPGLGAIYTSPNPTGRILIRPGAELSGTAIITVTVNDGAETNGSITRTFNLVVTPVNDPPVVSPVANRTIDEGDLASVTLSASDVDSPVNEITFALGDGTPDGVSLNVTSGELSWRPSEQQGPGNYAITVIASDSGTPPASSQIVVNVGVAEVNQAPVVTPRGSASAREEELTSLSIVGTDEDLPANTLRYRIAEGPDGVAIDPISGLFSWTPTELQSPGLYTVKIELVDNGNPALSGETAFEINVAAVNDPPSVSVPGAQGIEEDQDLVLTTIRVQDGDSGDLPVSVSLKVGNGLLSQRALVAPLALGQANQGLQFSSDTIGLNGTVTEINDQLRAGIVYRPNSEFSGSDQLVVEINDLGASGEGSARTALGVIEIEVGPVNDPPLITSPGSFDVDEDGELVVTGLSVSDVDAGNAEVSASISVQNGLLFANQTGVGSKTIEGNFTLVALNERLNQGLLYRPDPDFFGDDNLTISINDGGNVGGGGPGEAVARVPINVVSVNDVPTISSVGNLEILSGNPVPSIEISVTDKETAPAGLTVVGQSSNPDLLRDENIVVTGEGLNRLVGITVEPRVVGSTTVTLTLEDGDGGSAVSQFALDVGGLPPFIDRTTPAQVVKNGADVTLQVQAQGSAPLSYQWFVTRTVGGGREVIDGATDPELLLANVGLETIGGYSVDVSNELGVATSNVIPLLVNAPPVILTQPQDLAVLEGETATLSVGVEDDGVGLITLQWFRGDELLGTLGNEPSAIKFDQVQASDSGRYSVVVTRELGGLSSSVRSRVAQLGVGSLPVISVPELFADGGVAQRVTGEDLVFSVSATGSGPLTVEWFKDGEVLVGATELSLAIDNLAAADGGGYQVRVTNEFGFDESSIINLVVIVPITNPNIIGLAPTPEPDNSIFVKAGDPVELEVQFEGDLTELQIRWLRDGSEIPDESGTTIRRESIGLKSGGVFTAIVDNAAGVPTTSPAFIVRVGQEPRILRNPQPSVSGLVAGDSISYTIDVSGTDPLSIQWTQNGDPIAGATTVDLTIVDVRAATAGDYQALVSNRFGTVASEVATINFSTPPVVTLVSPLGTQLVAIGSDIELNATATGKDPLRLQWFQNGRNASISGLGNVGGADSDTLSITGFSVENGGNFQLAASDEFGAGRSEIVTLVPDFPVLGLGRAFEGRPSINDPSGEFRDDNVGGSIETFGGRINPVNLRSGVFFAYLAPSSGIFDLDLSGSAIDTFVGVFLGDDPATATQLATDDDSGFGNTSSVRVEMVQGTTYNVVIFGRGGASGDLVLRWNLTSSDLPLPIFGLQPVDTTGPLGGVATFTAQAVAEGNPTIEYQWFNGGDSIAGATGASILIENITEIDAGSYTVQATVVGAGGNRGTTVDSDSANLVISIDEVIVSSGFFGLLAQGGAGPLGVVDQPNRIALQGGSFGQPIQLQGFATGGYTSSQIFSTTGGFKEPGEPDHCGEIGGASQWLFFQPVQDGVIRISTEGSEYDTVLAVYTGPGTDFTSLVSVVCDNNSGADGVDSVVTLDAVAGTFYFVAVDGVGGASGIVSLQTDLATPPVFVQSPALGGGIAQQSVRPLGQPQLPIDLNEGSQVLIEAVASDELDGSGIVYQWQYRVDDSGEFLSLDGETAASLQLNPVVATDRGFYRVVATNFAGSSSSDAIQINVLAGAAIVDFTESKTVLLGSDITLSVAVTGEDPITYQWAFNGSNIPDATDTFLVLSNLGALSAGRYEVFVENSLGGDSKEITLSLEKLIQMTQQPNNQVRLVGQSVTFEVQATGENLTYQWRFEGTDIAGATAPTFTIASVVTGDVGAYTVVASNVSQSVESDPATLSLTTPLAILEHPANASVTAGSGVSFTVVAQGTPSPSFQWFKDGAPLNGETANVLTISPAAVADGGGYSIEVTDGTGTLGSNVATLTVIEAETLRIEEFGFNQDAQFQNVEFRFLIIGTVGDTYTLERSGDVADPAAWTTVETGVLDANSLEIIDANLEQGTGIPVYYRLSSIVAQ